MKDLVTYLVSNLVENQDAVRVDELAGEAARVYEVRVAPEYLGKLIGKQGRTIRSLVSLVNAAATKTGVRVSVEVVES